MYLRPSDYKGMDLLLVLNGQVPDQRDRGQCAIKELPLRDYGGVPDDWREQLETRVIPQLMAGEKILAFCSASHGRTGTFLASLIALLESEDKTPDPIKAVRERHCKHAVETTAQAEAIFALRGQEVPEVYWGTFVR